MPIERQPREGDNIWVQSRHECSRLQPNGKIESIQDDQVLVRFHDGLVVDYPIEALVGNWVNNRTGGQWQINL